MLTNIECREERISQLNFIIMNIKKINTDEKKVKTYPVPAVI